MISFACTQRFILKMGFANVFWVFLVFLLFSFAQPVFAADLFVTPNGSGDGSQSSPCSLEAAMAQALSNDTIYVAEGIYTDSGDPDAVINISQNLNIYGGWNGAWPGAVECDPEVCLTIFDGQEGKRGVYVFGTISVVLDGLTIKDGRTTDANGAGLYAQNADLTLNNLIFHGNVSDRSGSLDSAYGGGAYVENGSLAVNDCIFESNAALAGSSYGGGMAIKNVSPAAVENCVFEKNVAYIASGVYFNNENSGYAPFVLQHSMFKQNGSPAPGVTLGFNASAVYIEKAEARIEENTFIENQAVNNLGAVAISSSSDLLLTRNIIYNNVCDNGLSAIYISNTSPFIISNNMIADNRSDGVGAPAVRVIGGAGQLLYNTIARNDNDYGVQLQNGADVTLTNNIVVGHPVGVNVISGAKATMEATLWGSGIWANDTDWTGTGTINTKINLWKEPGFVAPDAGDYHIGPGSAARNAGVDSAVTLDIDGDARPIGPGFDIGADESDGVVITPVLMLLLSE